MLNVDSSFDKLTSEKSLAEISADATDVSACREIGASERSFEIIIDTTIKGDIFNIQTCRRVTEQDKQEVDSAVNSQHRKGQRYLWKRQVSSRSGVQFVSMVLP